MKTKMKRLLSLLLALTMMLSVITPVSANAADIIQLPDKTVELEVGQTTKIQVNGFFKKTTWTTSDENIATVSGDGTVSGIAAGTAIITATSEGFTPWSKTTVTKYTVMVTEPEEVKKIEVKVGESYQLTLKTSGGRVTWKSSDKRIAEVNKSGLVTGVTFIFCGQTMNWSLSFLHRVKSDAI